VCVLILLWFCAGSTTGCAACWRTPATTASCSPTSSRSIPTAPGRRERARTSGTAGGFLALVHLTGGGTLPLAWTKSVLNQLLPHLICFRSAVCTICSEQIRCACVDRGIMWWPDPQSSKNTGPFTWSEIVLLMCYCRYWQCLTQYNCVCVCTRCVYSAAVWYHGHLAGVKPVVMITENASAVAQYSSFNSGIYVVSMQVIIISSYHNNKELCLNQTKPPCLSLTPPRIFFLFVICFYIYRLIQMPFSFRVRLCCFSG